MVVARKFFERAITISAKLDNPSLSGEHLVDMFGNLPIILDVQNRDLGRGPLRTWLCDFLLDLSGFGKKVLSSLSHGGPCLEQLLVSAIYYGDQILMMTEAKQTGRSGYRAPSVSQRAFDKGPFTFQYLLSVVANLYSALEVGGRKALAGAAH